MTMKTMTTIPTYQNVIDSHYGKQNDVSSKKLKLELPYDPAIPLSGV